MTTHPVELIGGLTNSSNVPKSDLVSFLKARTSLVMADADEVRNTVLGTQRLVHLMSTNRTYALDTSDTTTPDDGLECIVSSDGKRFKGFTFATESEAIAGTANDVLMTPLRTAQCISERAPAIAAWDRNVPGDGSDQTTPLQAIYDSLPTEGGDVLLRGDVRASAINLNGRRNIRTAGVHGAGAGPGAGQRTMLSITAGSIGVLQPAINCRSTYSIGFQRLYIRATNAAFNGRLIDFGAPSSPTNSAYMNLDDLTITVGTATAATGLTLYGATNGQFSRIAFGGHGRHVAMQTVAGVGFCNNHEFSNCAFLPGAIYPVLGSGEGITFRSCCWQAGTDGVGRGVQTSGAQPFKGLKFDGCTFYDPIALGDDWIYAQLGSGFDMVGCRVACFAGSHGVLLGGVAVADPQESGVRGVNIIGNFFDGSTNAIHCLGTIAAKSNVRGGLIAANSVTIGGLIGNYAQAEQLMFGPNSIYGAPLGVGSHLMLHGLPSYASDAAAVSAGLQVGQAYRVGNELRVV
jgi:hypothetical protein